MEKLKAIQFKVKRQWSHLITEHRKLVIAAGIILIIAIIL
tara:strand:- start:190 stop:309 length:120 start_codon:yes stop_codon:yes gene_type:complete